MNPEQPPILVQDDKDDGWVVYPSDNAYEYVAALPRGDNGVVHVESSVLASVQGWWYTKAQEKVNEFLEALEIPWAELEFEGRAAIDEEAPALSERLARVSTYMVRVGRERARVDSELYLARAALEHAVQRRISQDDTKMTIAAKTAALISGDKRLRNAKIDVMEGEAFKRSLDGVSEVLDIIWKTTSRVLAVRLREPVE